MVVITVSAAPTKMQKRHVTVYTKQRTQQIIQPFDDRTHQIIPNTNINYCDAAISFQRTVRIRTLFVDRSPINSAAQLHNAKRPEKIQPETPTQSPEVNAVVQRRGCAQRANRYPRNAAGGTTHLAEVIIVATVVNIVRRAVGQLNVDLSARPAGPARTLSADTQCCAARVPSPGTSAWRICTLDVGKIPGLRRPNEISQREVSDPIAHHFVSSRFGGQPSSRLAGKGRFLSSRALLVSFWQKSMPWL